MLLVASVAFAADVTPRLDAPAVSPASGTTSTTFRYSIVYYGPEPSGHDVHIDGLGAAYILSMHRVSTDANGGATHVYEAKLTAGTHRYRFNLKVGATTRRKPGPTGDNWYTGPTVTAAVETCTISGLIKANDIALAGVEVKLRRNDATVKTTTADAEGRCTLTGLAKGTYVVLPTKSGYRMDPLTKLVTVGPSTTTCNFRAIKLSSTCHWQTEAEPGRLALPLASTAGRVVPVSASRSASSAAAVEKIAPTRLKGPDDEGRQPPEGANWQDSGRDRGVGETALAGNSASALNVHRRAPLSRSQTFSVWSSDTEAARRPSAVTATAQTSSLCPVRVRSSGPPGAVRLPVRGRSQGPSWKLGTVTVCRRARLVAVPDTSRPPHRQRPHPSTQQPLRTTDEPFVA